MAETIVTEKLKFDVYEQGGCFKTLNATHGGPFSYDWNEPDLDPEDQWAAQFLAEMHQRRGFCEGMHVRGAFDFSTYPHTSNYAAMNV